MKSKIANYMKKANLEKFLGFFNIFSINLKKNKNNSVIGSAGYTGNCVATIKVQCANGPTTNPINKAGESEKLQVASSERSGSIRAQLGESLSRRSSA